MVKMCRHLVMLVAASAREDAEAMLQVSKLTLVNEMKSAIDGITVQTKDAAPTPFRWSPGWFVDEVAVLKQDAAVLVADAASCNEQSPSDALPEAARHAHSTCRVEQLAMVGLNSGKDCEESKKKDCDVLQSQFEQVVCAHGKSCKAVDACHKGVADAMIQLKEREAEHKEMFVVATKEDCGRQHRHNAKEKAACAALRPDTSHLSITYASKPDVVCAHPRVEYSGKNWSQLAVAVTPCLDVTVEVQDLCIHALGDKPATFRLPGDMTVSELIFTRKSGGLTCRRGTHRSYFGCDHDSLGLVITEKDKKEVLMPLATQKIEGLARMSHKHAHWYKLQGVGATTPQMKWKFGMQPALGNGEYQLWYNEDLSKGTVGDNAGTACYDVEILGSKPDYYYVNKGVSGCTSASTCEICEGDCDNDADCSGTLKCFHRTLANSKDVPGCKGKAIHKEYDYCYDPASS